jgi:acyl-CoA thioesterase
VSTRFERDTAVVEAGPARPGSWEGRCDDGWFTPRGPNGGYVAAIVLRAMLAELAARGVERPARSVSLHYLRPPGPGPLTVTVTVERAGRSLSSLSARLEQDGKVCVLALGAFSVDFDGAGAYADPPPTAIPFDEAMVAPSAPELPSLFHRFELRPAIGHLPFSGADEALTGGWVTFADGPQELDAPALAQISDVWLPTAWVRMTEMVPAPTVDLTIHFRAPEVRASEPVLAEFRSRFAHGGFFEEDGEIWSADGTLLAQARQLALLVR